MWASRKASFVRLDLLSCLWQQANKLGPTKNRNVDQENLHSIFDIDLI